MSNLTKTQFRWLQWLAHHGGRAVPMGLKVKIAGSEEETNTGAAISFLNLVSKGAVAGRDGYLEITDYGRRLVSPFPQKDSPPQHSEEPT